MRRVGFSSLRVLVLMMGLIALPAAAMTFGAGIANSQWYLNSSIFSCQLTHEIPNFGKAVFSRKAGGSLHFYLEPDINPMRPGKAALVIESPAWRPGAAVRALGYVSVSHSDPAVDVGPREATAMMVGLEEGMMPTLTRKAWYNNQPVRVRISAINFMGKMSDYRSCVSGLLPVNFQQVRKTRVLFGDNSAKLTPRDRSELDKVALYVKADPSVTDVFVDGHSDRTGRRIYNRLLSKSRAQAVTQYLVDQGVAASKITTRYHGERFPISKNPALNRRATVRLERNGSNHLMPQSADEGAGVNSG